MTTATLNNSLTAHRDRILLVEDDDAFRARVSEALRPLSARVEEAGTAEAALSACAAHPPLDLVLLDLGLPDLDGLTLLKRIRTVLAAPVIVLSARSNVTDKVALLEAGADDYVTKPCESAELLARVRGQLRRSHATGAAASAVVVTGEVEIDFARGRVRRGGTDQRLTPTEWVLLRALVMNAGSTMPTLQLWQMVWRRAYGDGPVHVRVLVTRLRRKIEADPARPRLIVTEPGIGYRFELP